MIALLMMQVAASNAIPPVKYENAQRISILETNAYLQMVIVPNNPKTGTVLLCQQAVEPGGTYPKAPDDYSLLSCRVRPQEANNAGR